MSDWARKFGLTAGMTVYVIDPPADELEVLRSGAPPGVVLTAGLAAEGQVKSLFFWPTQLHGLEPRFLDLRRRLADDGSLWAVLPKKAQRAEFGVDMTWEEMQAAALTTDLIDVKVASFSNRTYGTKFVVRKAARGGG
ncbi:MAG: hypothetical protein WBR18_14785 [Anaerolineales bacterium]